MAKPTFILPSSPGIAARFKVLASQGPGGVSRAAEAAGLKFESQPKYSKGRVPEKTIYHEESWRFEEYKGAVNDLIAVGLMEPHMKPSKIGRQVEIASTGNEDPARRRIRWQTPHIVTVFVYVSDELGEQRRNADYAEQERQQQQERRFSAAAWLEHNRAKNYQKEIDKMPKTAEQFRTEASEYASHVLGNVKWLISDGGNGYHYAEDVLCEVDRLACEIEQLLLDGETSFDQAERDSEIRELLALGAKYNPQLQNLLTAATAADLVKNEQQEAS